MIRPTETSPIMIYKMTSLLNWICNFLSDRNYGKASLQTIVDRQTCKCPTLTFFRIELYHHMLSYPVFTRILVKQWRLVPFLVIFQKYSCSKLKVILNHAQFWTFFATPNYNRWCPLPPKNLYARYQPHLALRHMAKFHYATPFGFKVIVTNSLQLKPILDPLWKKL